MYNSFFGLSEKPFAITPDPRYLYLSERHAEALAHLLYGINESGGFIQLTGEVGTGKTTVVRTLLSRVPHHADVAVILNPRLTPVEFLLTICEELGLSIEPADRNSVKHLVDALNQRLLAAHAEGRRIIVIVDEAQNLSANTLEQVRLLTNLETPTQKLLQIILIGQPELRELLDRNDLRQLAQRITGRYHLMPLSLPETQGYVRHRLRVAGATGEIFTAGALREVHRLTAGIPRVINVACDRALLGAYTREERRVTAALVRHAASEVYDRRYTPGWLAWTAGVVLAAGFVFAAFMGWRTWQNRPADVRAAAPPPAGSPPLPSETPPLAPATPLEPGAAQPVAAATPTVPGATLPLAGANSPAPSATPPLAAANSPVTSATPPLAAVNSTVTSATPPVAAANSPAPSATPPVAAAIPSLPISALLAANGAYTTDAVAFRRLLSLWGTAMTDDRDPCGQAQKAGLACLDQRGSWAQVRALNRPAILSLVDDTGHKHRVVISALDDNYATLDLGEHSQRVAVDEVSRDWPGDFTVIWKPKTTHTRELSVGMRGDEVRWLRRSLNALQGSTANPDHGDLYDEQLAIEVQNFQREHRLDVNGIAGLQTQAVLDTALADPDSPLLLRTTPTPRG